MGSLSRLSKADLQQLEDFGYCVASDFLETKGLRDDLLSLRELQHFSVAKTDWDGQIQDDSSPFRDIRHSETCSLWEQDHMDKSIPFCGARAIVFDILKQMKQDLVANDIVRDETTQMTLDPSVQEVMYAYYPRGGYYRRHVDAEASTTSSFRVYSFLLYLSDWQEGNGGCLRLHFDSGIDSLPPSEIPHFIDVAPKAGTLVVFRSDQVPHEALTSYAQERLALVGWFWAPPTNTDLTEKPRSLFPSNKVPMQTICMNALQTLRDAIPSLKDKLEPPVEYQSGLLNDSNDMWSVCMPSATVERPEHTTQCQDTNPSYWERVAKFDILGRLVTLSLGGVRLRKVDNLEDVCTPLVECLTTLDLSNTDIDPVSTASLLRRSTALKHLYLGGNAWSNVENIRCVAAAIPLSVQVLDFRYSSWNPEFFQAFLFPNETTDTLQRVEKLYLEGNPLGDSSMEYLSKALERSRVRELFLGQCSIGAIGAKALASTLCTTLEKLYLEGNSIGPYGAQAMLESKLLPRLKKLYVDNNGIPKELSIRLGQALQSPTMIGNGVFYGDS